MKSPNIDLKFLEYVLDDLSRENIRLVIHPSKRTNDGIYGSFDDEEKVLNVALYNELGFNAVLAHEYGHYRQYIENPNLYAGYGILGDWVSSAKDKIKNYTEMLSNETIEEACLVVMACEKDAEEFAMKMAEEWKFPEFNKSQYFQYANLYLYSIRHSFVYREYPSLKKKDRERVFKFIPNDRMISLAEACELPKDWIEWWNEKQENISRKDRTSKKKEQQS